IAVGRTIELGGVTLERMSAELLDVDRDRRRQALWAQRVEAQGPAVGAGQERQSVLLTRLVAGHQRRTVLNSGVGSGQMGDSRLRLHRHPPRQLERGKACSR